MKKFMGVLMVISFVFFGCWIGSRVIRYVDFKFNCEEYIKRAANSSTVELAKENLDIAIEYAEKNELTDGISSIFLKNPKNDVGFWYDNMKAAGDVLASLNEDSDEFEKSNILMKLREVLMRDCECGNCIRVPEGISIYPNNVAYFWWGLLSFIASLVFLFLFVLIDD